MSVQSSHRSNWLHIKNRSAARASWGDCDMANTCSHGARRHDRLSNLMRHTTFRFALAPTAEQARTLARHGGASRFAFNQSLQLVTEALATGKVDPSVTVPWSGLT